MRLQDAANKTRGVRLEPEPFRAGENGGPGVTWNIWLVDRKGRAAISPPGLAMLAGIDRLLVPAFAGTEHAMRWGSQLGPEEHAALAEMQRGANEAALRQRNPRSKADFATRSQLLREAGEAFVPAITGQNTLAGNVADGAAGGAR